MAATSSTMDFKPWDFQNYTMNLRDKGLAFILNNNNFCDGRLVRKGSEIDVTNAEHVFREIGYTPIIERNLTAHDIMEKLQDMIQRKLKRYHPSVVLLFMSHGVRGGILGTDGRVITVEDIKELFSGKNCPALIGKPKMMFFQACRGEKVTRSAIEADIKPWTLADQVMMPQMTNESDGTNAASNSLVAGRDEARLIAEPDYGIAENADIFIAHATSEGYFSMRDRVNGSWFIQALCEELLARAHVEDLDSIMTKVISRVKRREESITLNGERIRTMQTPQVIKQGIGKQIFFLPKYPPS